MRIRHAFDFEAAHSLPRHKGKCRGLHGHSYALTVTVERPTDPESGMVMDFDDLAGIVRREVLDGLDHRLVNDVMENPTAENMSLWIWRRLIDPLPGLVEIELHETRECSVVCRGE